jgi:hypothetical protein|tara:strand:+ start:7194 stop:7532 length:339 start_codon:yes stop_codon:yes gene_type:complete
MTKLVDYDPYTGITETFHKDAISGVIKVNKSQPTQTLTDNNNRERIQSGSGWKEEFHKVASIPLIVIETWREELKAMGGRDSNPLAKSNEKWFIAKLNSSDFLKLRTKEGVI